MSQVNELNAIKSKIFALTQKTTENGCTEAEAMAAVNLVGKLLQRYDLDMTDIYIKEATCESVVVETNSKRQHPLAAAMLQVAKFCDCIMYRTWKNSNCCYVIFGFQHDAGMAVYLCSIIEQAYNTELNKFKNSEYYKSYRYNRRIINTDFTSGFVSGVVTKIKSMKEARNRETAAYEDGTKGMRSTAIVLMKTDKVKEEFQKTNVHLVSRSIARRSIASSSAYHNGYSSGSNVAFNKGVSGGNNRKQLA